MITSTKEMFLKNSTFTFAVLGIILINYLLLIVDIVITGRLFPRVCDGIGYKVIPRVIAFNFLIVVIIVTFLIIVRRSFLIVIAARERAKDKSSTQIAAELFSAFDKLGLLCSERSDAK